MRERHRFRPLLDGLLEERICQSRGFAPVAAAIAAARAARLAHATPSVPVAPPPRVPFARPAPPPRPVEFIAQQYATFQVDFLRAFNAYMDTIPSTGGQTVTVSEPLVTPYVPGSGILTVASGTAFALASPSVSTPLIVTATTGTAAIATFAVGGVSGNNLFLLPTADPGPALPVGVQIEATLNLNGNVIDTAAEEFTSYTVQRSNALAQSLVQYYNRLPVKLPKAIGRPRQPQPRNAIQTFIANSINGPSPLGLAGSLTGIPLPLGFGPAVDVYVASALTTIATSRDGLNEGIRLIYTGQDVIGDGNVIPTVPASPLL
jgi:hypothetical protein